MKFTDFTQVGSAKHIHEDIMERGQKR